VSAFIVSAGVLLEVGAPSTLTRSTESRAAFTGTIGGKRKGFIRRGGRREWALDVSIARPGMVSTIETIARNGGPVGWYGSDATVGNLLSPQASGFDVPQFNATDAGLVQLPDGTIARAVVLTGAVSIGTAHGSFEAVPVVPGSRITVSGWGLGGLRFTGTWRDQTYATTGFLSGTTFTHNGWGFASQTFTVPATASALSIVVQGATQVARPSIAWGASARDELGTGCPVAVIHGATHAPITLMGAANYSKTSYQVTEVG